MSKAEIRVAERAGMSRCASERTRGRVTRWHALVLASALLVSPCGIAGAEEAPADAVSPSVATTTPHGIAWTQLTADEQELLAPVRDQWQQLPPAQQMRLRRKADRWQDMTPERREIAKQRLTRFAEMTPEQRAAARERYRAFQQLSPEQKKRVRNAFHRFQELSPDERRALRERFERSQPQQSTVVDDPDRQ